MTLSVYNSSLHRVPLTAIAENASENATDGEEVLPDEIFQANCTANCTCTPLSRLDLMDVFTRMDIGNAEFWGNMSIAWVTCFIVYYIVFSILLVIMAYNIIHFLKGHLRFFVCILILFIVWSSFSCIHHTLLMNSVVNGNTIQLANTTRTLEIITSSSFMNFAIVTILSNSRSSWRYTMSIIIPIYLIAGVIIVVSLLAQSSALIALIILRSLIFIASIILVNLDSNYKQCFKIKEQFHLLWERKKILIYPHFFISLAYFLYTLITIASNSNCIENVQLHRAVWLAFNCLLRICEVGFSIVYFVKIRTMINTLPTLSKDEGSGGLTDWIKSHFTGRQEHHKPPLKSSSFTYQPPLSEINIHYNFSPSTQSTNLKTDKDTGTVVSDHFCQSNIIKEQNDQIIVVHGPCCDQTNNTRNGIIEREPLFQNPNYRHYSENSSDLEAPQLSFSLDSTITCSLSTDISRVNSIAYSNESLYTTELSSIINDGKVIEYIARHLISTS